MTVRSFSLQVDTKNELLLQLKNKTQRTLTRTCFTSNETSPSVADTHGLNYTFLF
jgi:hypothetical protein